MSFEDHQEIFYKDDKDSFKIQMNIWVKYAELKSKYFSKDTMIGLKNNRLLIVGENPKEYLGNSSTNTALLKFYRVKYLSCDDEIELQRAQSLSFEESITKIICNEEEDLLFVGFANGQIKVFYFSEERVHVKFTSYKLSLVVKEIKHGLKGVYNCCSMALATLSVNKLRAESFKKNNFIKIYGGCNSLVNQIKCLLVFNESESALEVFRIANSDDISIVMSYKITNLCHVERIQFLDNNWIALGGRTRNTISKHKNFFLMNMKTLEYRTFGWNTLNNVSDILYIPHKNIVCVSSEVMYFSAFLFDRYDGFLEELGQYTPNADALGAVYFNYVKSNNHSFLILTNSTNTIFTYKISQGKPVILSNF